MAVSPLLQQMLAANKGNFSTGSSAVVPAPTQPIGASPVVSSGAPPPMSTTPGAPAAGGGSFFQMLQNGEKPEGGLRGILTGEGGPGNFLGGLFAQLFHTEDNPITQIFYKLFGVNQGDSGATKGPLPDPATNAASAFGSGGVPAIDPLKALIKPPDTPIKPAAGKLKLPFKL